MTSAPVIAPIAGGWIVDNPKLGWRWTEWVTLIISGAAFLIALLFLPETYLPLLLDWKAKHLRRVTGDDRYVSEHDEAASFMRRMRQVLPLPAKFGLQSRLFPSSVAILFSSMFYCFPFYRGSTTSSRRHTASQQAKPAPVSEPLRLAPPPLHVSLPDSTAGPEARQSM